MIHLGFQAKSWQGNQPFLAHTLGRGSQKPVVSTAEKVPTSVPRLCSSIHRSGDLTDTLVSHTHKHTQALANHIYIIRQQQIQLDPWHVFLGLHEGFFKSQRCMEKPSSEKIKEKRKFFKCWTKGLTKIRQEASSHPAAPPFCTLLRTSKFTLANCQLYI